MTEQEAAAAAATEEKKEETTEEKKEETTEEKKEETKPAPRKNTRAEKKMKEALCKHGIKPLEGVKTVMMRKGVQIMWTFTDPDVYCLENVYVVFGEPSMQNNPGQQAFKQLIESADVGQEKKDEPSATVVDDTAATGDEPDATGLKEEDIQTIMQQANVNRARAIEALRGADGDLVTAVMNLAL